MFNDGWFVRFVLVLWLVSAVFIMFSLERIDWIVHHDLYNFGLQFSDEWALTYWAFLRMIYVFLAFPFVFSAAYFISDIWRFISVKRKNVVKAETSEPKTIKPVRREVKALEPNHMLISCPKCKKFSANL